MQGGWDGERIWSDAGGARFCVRCDGLPERLGRSRLNSEKTPSARSIASYAITPPPHTFVSYKVSD